jgi:hypothetical protein
MLRTRRTRLIVLLAALALLGGAIGSGLYTHAVKAIKALACDVADCSG